MTLDIELWTDGSGNRAADPGGWAYVLVARNGTGVVSKHTAFGAVSTGGSNNRMELAAVLFGLRALTRPVRVTVYTDSEYVGKAFPHGWLDAWDRRDWHDVKNPDLWRDLRAEVERHTEVLWELVPGHAGLEFNEEADRLAGAARKAIKELLPKPVARSLF